jgi:Bacterial PH domain
MRAVSVAPKRGQEHEFEAQFGLPEKLPAGEHILWQGQPQVALVARRIFHVPLIAGYFAVLLVWHLSSSIGDGLAWNEALRAAYPLMWVAGVALAIFAALAHWTARTTAYTLTNQRVVMRIGIVLTVTYNLPLRCIDAAHWLPLGGGRGEIALALRGDTRIAWLHLWPHARAWHLRRPQPMLRGLGDGEAVSKQLVQAWSAANAQAAQPRVEPEQTALPAFAGSRSAA